MNPARKLRLLRVFAVIAIALGAGHVAQYNSPRYINSALATADLTPVEVVSLASVADVRWVEPALADSDLPILPQPGQRPDVAAPARLEMPDIAQINAAAHCAPRLTLAATAGAMIDLRLTATCRANERVVVRHSGLAVTYRTNSVGALSASLPAMTSDVSVSVLFAGGETVQAALVLPEADNHRRFGVQWLGAPSFAVNAFENGADYGMPGHVSAADPHQPGDSLLPLRGFLTVLGDDQVDMPMLAEVFTFPAGSADVPVLVEVAVTDASCGHEILGETLNVVGGVMRVADLSVTMPGCDATGDYLVLKNLVPDLKLAAAN